MTELAQGDFARAVRGGHVDLNSPANIEPVVMGISSIARAAVRSTHNRSPAVARSYFTGKVARFLLMGGNAAATARSYRASLDCYICWDGGSGPAEIDVKGTITFQTGDAIRAIGHVVLLDPPATRTARVLLWDDLAINTRAAEMIALPVFECVDSAFGQGVTASVDVWQLARQQCESVLPAAAQARRGEIEALFAQF